MQQIMCKESFFLWYIEYCNDFIHTTFVQNTTETRLALVKVSWTRTVSACVPVTQFDHAVNPKLKKNVSRLILINITRCYKSNNWWWIVKIFKCIPLKKKCQFYKIIVMVAPNIVKIIARKKCHQDDDRVLAIPTCIIVCACLTCRDAYRLILVASYLGK